MAKVGHSSDLEEGESLSTLELSTDIRGLCPIDLRPCGVVQPCVEVILQAVWELG